MKITRSQLKQIIKEELGEVDSRFTTSLDLIVTTSAKTLLRRSTG
jgi:hypothetical protein